MQGISKVHNSSYCLSIDKLTSEELREAKPLVLHDIIDGNVIKTSILETLSDDIGLKPGRKGVNLRNLDVLCANLKKGKVRSLSRNRNRWSGIPEQYNPVGLNYNMIPVVDLMQGHGYLEQKKGFKDYRIGKGFNTRIMPTPKFIETIAGATVIKHPDSPLLVLKDTNDNIVGYNDTGHTKTMKARLRRYNKLLAETNIEVDGSILDPTDKYVYRVFNKGKWSLGGRFYGAIWHTCKKKLRDTITINDEPTVEPDYSALHPCIMYAMTGLEMPPGDLYDLPGVSDRKYGKVAMLIMVNAENRRSAIGAYNDKFKGDPLRPKASEVFNKILEKHPHEIQAMFFSGIGLKLQGKDSKLADTVIDIMTKETIPILSVHDSFRVQERYQDRLIDVMSETYRRQWGEQSKVPEIHT